MMWRFRGVKIRQFSTRRNTLISLLWNNNPQTVHIFLQQNITKFSADDIATIFFTSAKRNCKLESSDIFDLAKHLQRMYRVKPLVVANILNGLRIHTSQDPAILYLLTVLKSKLDSLESDMPPHLISLALFGMKKMNGNPHTLSLLESLADRIQSSPSYPIPPIEFGNTLFGLQNFTSEDSRVITFLESLQYILEPYRPSSTSKKMTSRSLAQSLYGLKGMSWNHRIVRNLYQLLLPHMIHCDEPFDKLQLGAAFYGIQKYTESDPLCCDILTVLEKKICKVSFPLNGATIGSVLYGFQNLTSNSSVTLSLLRHVTPLIYSLPSHERITSHSLASALYGLRNMSNTVKEVDDVLHALETLIPKCVQIQERQGTIMLLGLRKMNANHPSVRKFLQFIYQIFVQTTSLQPVPGPLPVTDQFPILKPSETTFESDGSGSASLLATPLSTPTPEVIPTARILQNHHFSLQFHLTSEIICKCIHSFQCMSSDHSEVIQLLQYFLCRLESSHDFLRSKDVGLCLYGLQGMSPFHPVVKRAFAVLTKKLQTHFSDQFLFPYDVESAEITLSSIRKNYTLDEKNSQAQDWHELKALEEMIQQKKRVAVPNSRY